ncbi:MAG TPA: hypothetical protein VF612_10710 [Jatrophihabitans sp.]|jgi:hypothetical protein|uniref:hypothetical protein n=1 Tax=Jatrophihabitans sp. TaxID=1932789 RepID=UPI002F112348
MTGYPSMPPAHQPGGPRSRVWIWVLGWVIVGVLVLLPVVTVLIIGIQWILADDP